MHTNTVTKIDANGLSPHELNETIKALITAGEREFELSNVNGQRFIGAGITEDCVQITIDGTPGNDLGMFSENIMLDVYGNAQDGVGNTMSSGTIVIHGHSGDVLGYGMRGGTVIVEGDAGYRCGISMKEFSSHRPTIIIGGRVRDFLGEYMAGGTILILGLHSRFSGSLVGSYVGTGMHAGAIYVRGQVERRLVHQHLEVKLADEEDMQEIVRLSRLYAQGFGPESAQKVEEMLKNDTFTKICASTSRPYGNLYSPM